MIQGYNYVSPRKCEILQKQMTQLFQQINSITKEEKLVIEGPSHFRVVFLLPPSWFRSDPLCKAHLL